MGIQFLNSQLIGPVPDPMHPPILVYEPDGDKLRLIAAEWFIPLATGTRSGQACSVSPSMGRWRGTSRCCRRTCTTTISIWLWKENPAGLFSPTNPSVTCAGYGYSLAEDAPHVVPHPRP
jgi:hypothetical protein